MKRILLTLKAFCWLILTLIPIILNRIWLTPYLNRFVGFATFTGKELIIQEFFKLLSAWMPFLIFLWVILIFVLFWYKDIEKLINKRRGKTE